MRRLGGSIAGSLPGATLIRVNVREPDGPPGTIGLALPALEALRRIDERIAPG